MIDFLAQYGYIGLFFGAIIAATLVPLSSDALMVGLLTTGADPVPVVAAATLGNWLGGMLSYGLGRLGKLSWLRMKPETVAKQQARVDRWGSLLAFFTWLPFIGDVMAVALGVYRLDARKVAIFMFIGKCTRYCFWALLYFWILQK